MRWKRSYVLSRFFNISIFTFETSIVGYAATFPKGESKKDCGYALSDFSRSLLLFIVLKNAV